MASEDKKRFSHIIVDGYSKQGEHSDEDETNIGVVEIYEEDVRSDDESIMREEVTGVDEDSGHIDVSGRSDATIHPVSATQRDGSIDTETSAHTASEPDDDLDYSTDGADPMSTTQKIVLVLCGVAVILVVVYVLNYWEVVDVPFLPDPTVPAEV